MKLERLVERACIVLSPRIARMAADAGRGPNDDFSRSYSDQFPLSDLFPANTRGNVGPVLDCINQAIGQHGFISDKALMKDNDFDAVELRRRNEQRDPPEHYARIDIIDRTVSDLQDAGYQEAHLCCSDPESVRRRFAAIAESACQIARARDLGHEDRPLT